MDVVRNIEEIGNLMPVASDLAELLSRPDNADIAVEFPATVARYTGDRQKVCDNLIHAQSLSSPGVRQQFVTYSGRCAVGLSIVAVVDSDIELVDDSTPNISLLICNPYRGLRYGKTTFAENLRVVREQFDGRAWTTVAKDNNASNAMVTRAGLEIAGEDNGRYVYLYAA